jgi:hypothetical protein
MSYCRRATGRRQSICAVSPREQRHDRLKPADQDAHSVDPAAAFVLSPEADRTRRDPLSNVLGWKNHL